MRHWLLACAGGLAFVVCAFGGFLLYFLIAFAFLTIAPLPGVGHTLIHTVPAELLSQPPW